MVTVIGTEKRKSSEGKEFNILILQGGVEFVKSKTTGKLYATARKATLVSTFDERTCNKLVGTEFPGTIDKVSCEPYNYQVPGSSEIIVLTHSYQYNNEATSMEEAVFA